MLVFSSTSSARPAPRVTLFVQPGPGAGLRFGVWEYGGVEIFRVGVLSESGDVGGASVRTEWHQLSLRVDYPSSLHRKLSTPNPDPDWYYQAHAVIRGGDGERGTVLRDHAAVVVPGRAAHGRQGAQACHGSHPWCRCPTGSPRTPEHRCVSPDCEPCMVFSVPMSGRCVSLNSCRKFAPTERSAVMRTASKPTEATLRSASA